MKTEKCAITKINRLSSSVVSLAFKSDYFSKNLKPGQFINVKIDQETPYLLRRPFSISDISDDEVFILFNIVGKGTFSLSEKKVGDIIDVLGPLGNGFDYTGNFSNAVIIGGGIGIAPFPFLIKELARKKAKIDIFFGYKTKEDILDFDLKNVQISTDDGSFGFIGNVNELFFSQNSKFSKEGTKIFGCGPNIMLKNLSELASKLGYTTEVSIESHMACGIGICQGCPVESRIEENRYYLVCKDGPCFNIKNIKL